MDALRMQVLASLLGIALHALVLRRVDIELVLLPFLSSMAVCLAGLIFATDTGEVSSTYTSLPIWVATIASFIAGLFVSIIVYRLFFHRLRTFPGPVMARVTRFYGLYLASKETKYHNELSAMHSQYGDFVRVGPRELSILRKTAVQVVHGPESTCQKSLWYSQFSTDTKATSVHTTRDFGAHRLRRKAWDQGFSIKALSMYEKRIEEQTELLITKLSGGQIFDGTQWSMFFSFDTLGEIGFGRSFGCLSSGSQHPAIHKIHEHMEVVGTVSQVPWLIYLVSQIPGATAAYSEFFRICEEAIDNKLESWNPDEMPKDIASWLLKAYVAKEKTAAPSKLALYEDSRVLIVAGSDTAAGVIAAALYYLAKNPSVQRKLQIEVDAVFDGPEDWTYEKAKSIPYIDHVINETLRLKPALMVGGPRVTPPGGIWIDEQYIPGDVNVITPIQQLQTDPRYWKRALDFIPERWGQERAEFGTDDAPFFPFGLGAYSCPGKMILYISLRMLLARIALQFDIVFAPGEDGTNFDTGAKETFSTTNSALMLQLVRRN